MLRVGGLVELIDVDECKRGQCDVQVELVLEINLVVVIVAQFGRQQDFAESRLATPLTTYQQRCQRIACQLSVTLAPLCHHTDQPVAQIHRPVWLVGRHTLSQFADAVYPIPPRQSIQPLVHGVILFDVHRVDESVHVFVKSPQSQFVSR